MSPAQIKAMDAAATRRHGMLGMMVLSSACAPMAKRGAGEKLAKDFRSMMETP